MRRAYYATDDWATCAYLVFAESAGEAKSIAFGLDGLDMGDYTDIRVRREPKADQYAKEFSMVAPWDSKRAQEILRSLGWYCGETPIYCRECDLGVNFDMLPESTGVYDDDHDQPICKGCAEPIAKRLEEEG